MSRGMRHGLGTMFYQDGSNFTGTWQRDVVLEDQEYQEDWEDQEEQKDQKDQEYQEYQEDQEDQKYEDRYINVDSHYNEEE